VAAIGKDVFRCVNPYNCRFSTKFMITTSTSSTSDPAISVITTTYNRVSRLKKAVKSVLNQTFTDWELIIVDDYSTDKTQKYCEKMVRKDNRIRYIRRSSNFGQHPRPKNEGTQAATADLVAYLDDDNEYRRDHLQVLYKYLGKNDVVYGDRWIVDDSGKFKPMKGNSSDFNAALLTQENYIDTSDVLIRKACIEAVGGWDEALVKYADWNLWVRMTKAGYRFQHVPIIITDYYVHPGCNQFKKQDKKHPITGKNLPDFSPDDCKIFPDKTLYGERPKLKVAIFTLTMNRLDYTKRMYESMKKNAGHKFDWFVYDNGSTDGTRHWILKNAEVKEMIGDDENVGISKASNELLDIIGEGYDVIIKADNDCLFLTKDWLKDIVDLYEKQRQFVVSPRVEGLRDTPGGVPRTQYAYVGEHFLGLAPHIGGICCAAPAFIYKHFRWEEDDFLHGDQDYTFSQYAIKYQYILAYLENVIVEHMDFTSFQAKAHPEYEAKKEKLKTTKYEPKQS
jgi:glycosyltransferase involved in cell wall biosynthesis